MTNKTATKVTRDEHAEISGVAGKKTFILDDAGNQITQFATATVDIRSSATIYAVVNTEATSPSNVTVQQGTTPWETSFKGNITIDSGTITTITNPIALKGNITIDSGVITTVTAVTDITNPVALKGNITIDSGTITAVTDITNPVATKGNVTIDSGTITAVTDITNPVALKGNITIDSGTITAVTDITNPVALKGNITIDSGTITAVTDITNPIAIKGNVTITDTLTSYYANQSLASGFKFHGFAAPGSNPTTAAFRLMRETNLTKEVLFGEGTTAYTHQWSVASMPSISWS